MPDDAPNAAQTAREHAIHDLAPMIERGEEVARHYRSPQGKRDFGGTPAWREERAAWWDAYAREAEAILAAIRERANDGA